MRFLKKYWQEIAVLAALELFVWSAARRYWGEPPESRWGEIALGMTAMVSGVALIILAWRLSKKWREQTKERVRAFSHRLLRRISERVMQMLEKWQRKYGKGADDLLGGRTRMEFDLYSDRSRRGKHRRAAWKHLEGERERICWLYAGMIENRLKRGALIRPSETPAQIARRQDTTPEQSELIELYENCRYDMRSEPPEGGAQRWRDHNG